MVSSHENERRLDAERAQHSPSDPSSTYIVLGTNIGTLPGSRGTNVGGLVSVTFRGKTPKGKASFGLPTFLSEWGVRRAARRAALNPRCRRAALRARRAAVTGAQGCLGGSAGLPCGVVQL